MKVAFLGLGVMGFPMAGHLKAGPRRHGLQPHRRQGRGLGREARRPLGMPTPKAAAEGQDIVFACVGNDDDLRSVVLGPDGAFAGMAKGAVFVDHTTASADVARELSTRSRRRDGPRISSTRRCPAARPAPRTARSP
jgi:3-hydroxyisobutyrate dehydrogenase